MCAECGGLVAFKGTVAYCGKCGKELFEFSSLDEMLKTLGYHKTRDARKNKKEKER